MGGLIRFSSPNFIVAQGFSNGYVLNVRTLLSHQQYISDQAR